MSFSPPDTTRKRSSSLVSDSGDTTRKKPRTDDPIDDGPAAEKAEPKPKSTRGVRACTLCRRIKMKCVGAEQGPPCKRCLTNNRECIINESNRGKRSSKKHELLTRPFRKIERTLDTVLRSIGNPSMSSGMISRSPSPAPSPATQTAQTQAPLQTPSPPPQQHGPTQTATLPSSPKSLCLPDNPLNPLGLLAEASLANRRAQGVTASFTVRPVDGDSDHRLGVASDDYFRPGSRGGQIVTSLFPVSLPRTEMGNLCAPPPLDLTPNIVGTGDQFSAGGSFGDVYRCRYVCDPVPKEVAVKAFRFKFTMEGDANDKSIKMLRRELGIWTRLDHINIVPFLGIAYGFGMSDSMSLVSLWMPNESLRSFLAKYDDRLDTGLRLRLLLDIANGLHYLHSFPIVHGDLNPNNVLLDADCTARLTDFGYASLVGNIPEVLGYLQRSTARPGALRWIAPEQVELEESFNRTTKSDIYSFGCIALQGSLFDVLTGKQPWSEVREDATVILSLVRGHKPGRPESRVIDDLHWDLIQYCWSPVEERPAAEVIVTTIQQFLGNYPPSRPLRNLLMSGSSQDDLGAASSSSSFSGRAPGKVM